MRPLVAPPAKAAEAVVVVLRPHALDRRGDHLTRRIVLVDGHVPVDVLRTRRPARRMFEEKNTNSGSATKGGRYRALCTVGDGISFASIARPHAKKII